MVPTAPAAMHTSSPPKPSQSTSRGARPCCIGSQSARMSTLQCSQMAADKNPVRTGLVLARNGVMNRSMENFTMLRSRGVFLIAVAAFRLALDVPRRRWRPSRRQRLSRLPQPQEAPPPPSRGKRRLRTACRARHLLHGRRCPTPPRVPGSISCWLASKTPTSITISIRCAPMLSKHCAKIPLSCATSSRIIPITSSPSKAMPTSAAPPSTTWRSATLAPRRPRLTWFRSGSVAATRSGQLWQREARLPGADRRVLSEEPPHPYCRQRDNQVAGRRDARPGHPRSARVFWSAWLPRESMYGRTRPSEASLL